MKTAISISDRLFREAEALARRKKTSRSRLYCQAIAEFLSRHHPDAVTEAMDRAVDELSPAADEALAGAARRVLERSEW